MGIIEAQELAEEYRRKTNPTLAEIEDELKELEERKKELQALYASKCDIAIKEAIDKSAQEKKIKRLTTSPNCFIIKFSDLCGKPWNVEFHDWYGSKKILLEYLSKKPIDKWHDCVIELVEKAKNGIVYIPLKKNANNCFSHTTTTPISLEFIQAVLNKL